MKNQDYNILTKNLTHTLFVQRETTETHERYEEELDRFAAIHEGNPEKTQAIVDTFRTNTYSHLSSDPVRNRRYLFVVNATMATRFSIEGGVPMETAYNISDLFIQRMDQCQTIDEINDLLADMVQTFAAQVALHKKAKEETQFSPSVRQGMDFIHNHLHDHLTLTQISREVHLSPTYYSALFQKETGHSISEYIMNEKIQAACNLLQYSNYSGAEIANYLAFSSHSHFCSQFKKATGFTPAAYRRKHFRNKWKS